MTSTLRILSPALISISLLAPANLFGEPIPQGNRQGIAPANHPTRAQVVLAPAPTQAGKLPAQEVLPADARKPDQVLRVGHSQPVEALAFSPDGKWLAQPAEGRVPSGAADIWDAATGQKLQNVPAHRLALIKLAFSRDGRWLVTVGKTTTP